MLTACDAVVDSHVFPPDLRVEAAVSERNPQSAAPPVLRVETPVYPAAVVYILYREYLHKHPGLTRLSVDDPKYQQYMERRLRQLYPNRGYSGMMQDAVAEARRHDVTWRRYEQQLEQQSGVTLMNCEAQVIEGDDCGGGGGGGGGGGTGGGYENPDADPRVDPSWNGQVEFAVPADEELPTIQMEIDTLMLDQPEVQEIYYYESLATGTYLAEPTQIQSVATSSSIDDLIRAAGEGHTPGPVIQIVPDIVARAIATLGVIGWKAYRIDQASKRAIARSAYYYPSLDYDDTKRDAHRHILWSMMLRRYVGATVAKALTDHHERDSSGAPKVMDLHNNDIGRSYRYNRFRNHWLWDRWDWHEWALRVRDYINNEAENGTYIPEWFTSQPTTAQAWDREASVPDARYIYFAP
jgi:hypothetical protein